MIKSEQMNYSVNNKEGNEIIVISLKFFRFDFGDFPADEYLAGILGEGKLRISVGLFIFLYFLFNS